MKARDFIKLGYQGAAIGVALRLFPDAKRALGARVLDSDLKALVNEPNAYTNHPHLALIRHFLVFVFP
ncbi:hypothetical protein [Acidovorax sp. BLS4]|uniref:hypothetical protein n=1 Tax=Acidovorax sp. BLS4 TaxID=3273430 RepID=UPI00294313ED|nr:hypothetical protein [Paracidovorax avenae]WOI45613.1 hypothetical protein R1Z03_24755 [Paracidovorax avenae]